MIQEKPLAQLSCQTAKGFIEAAGGGDLESAASKVVNEYTEMKIAHQG
jgi:hypothetical protein